MSEENQHVTTDALARAYMHHPPTTPDIIRAHEMTRANFHVLASWVNDLLPHSREKERSLEALDDAAKHANAAIARRQAVNPALLGPI